MRLITTRLGIALCAGVIGVWATEAAAVRIPGGGKERTDCYVEFDVPDIDVATSTRVVDCIDGDPCDRDGACNDSCRLRVALCLNQHDNEPTCIPPAPASPLKRVVTKGVALGMDVPPLDSSACGAFTDIDVPVKVRRAGRVKKPGVARLPVVAISPVKPKKDKDKALLTCLPRQNAGVCPASSTTTTTSSTSTTSLVPCQGAACGAERIVSRSLGTCSGTTTRCLDDSECGGGTCVTDGSLKVSTLAPFPFPLGVLTTVDTGPAVAPASAPTQCRHQAIVPAGGFVVPTFCIPALGFTSQVQYPGCESGTAEGRGTVWDGMATFADADVFKVADTSDGVCNPAGQTCDAAGAGGNTLGDVDTTRGDGVADGAGVQMQLDIPALSLTWNDDGGECPDSDGVYDAGTDTLVSQFSFILSPTTARSTGLFFDKNGDGCAFAGNGPSGVCQGTTTACSKAADCPGSTCVPRADFDKTGVPATGPCCVVGQEMTLVSIGAGFSSGAPLYDLLFASTIPSRITSCEAAQPLTSCTLTTDACVD